MQYVRNMTDLSSLTARQIALQTLLLTLETVAFFTLMFVGLALLLGLPPVDYAFGFVQEVAAPVSGVVFWLELIAFSFAAVACIGRWCLWQEKALLVESDILPGAHRLASLLTTVWQPLRSVCRLCIAAPDSPPGFPHLGYRTLASTPASLAGAAFKLE